MTRLLPLAVVVALAGCAQPTKRSPTDVQTERKPSSTLETVTFPAGKTTLSGFLCRPTGVGPYPGVLMIPDRLGVSESLKKQAYRLSQEGYVVLIVDPYRGEEPKTVKEAEEMERQLPKERVLGDLKAALDYLCKREDVRKPQNVRPDVRRPTLGVIGFGMGGRFALEAALNDARVRAVVSAYSPLPADAKRLKSLNGSVLCILAGKDKNATPDSMQPFCKAMANAAKPMESIRVYADCPYGFLDEANWSPYGKPDIKDVVDAWKTIAAYLDKELQ